MKIHWICMGLCAALALGCDKKAEESASASGGATKATAAKTVSAEEYSRSEAGRALEDVRLKLESGADANFTCARAQHFARKLEAASDGELVQSIEKLCGYEVPMASAELGLKNAEEAAQAGRKGGCYSAPWELGIEPLRRKHKDDPRVGKLEARWRAVCPNEG